MGERVSKWVRVCVYVCVCVCVRAATCATGSQPAAPLAPGPVTPPGNAAPGTPRSLDGLAPPSPTSPANSEILHRRVDAHPLAEHEFVTYIDAAHELGNEGQLLSHPFLPCITYGLIHKLKQFTALLLCAPMAETNRLTELVGASRDHFHHLASDFRLP